MTAAFQSDEQNRLARTLALPAATSVGNMSEITNAGVESLSQARGLTGFLGEQHVGEALV